MRNFLIAGNWKMNKGPASTRELLDNLTNEVTEAPDKVEILVCPPAISVTSALSAVEGTDIKVGVQHVSYEDDGALTGEISTGMVLETDATHVIVGHSERRQYFGETDATVNKRVKKILEDDLVPIICVGESLEQRQKDQHHRVVLNQIKAALNGLEADAVSSVVIAYEPVWAIGTGETATPEQAQEMHELIRDDLADKFGEEVSDSVQIVYGGSMKPHNAEELLSQTDVDGGLIGGASLKADSFSDIISVAAKLAG